MRRPRLRSSVTFAGKTIVFGMVALTIVAGLGLAAIETGWAKNRLRALIVGQANQYLAATLDIGRLEGSLLGGLQLSDIRLSQDGEDIVAIEKVAISYSLRELWQNGTIIRRVTLTRPRVVAAKLPDGRWNLGALLRRDAQRGERRGPSRRIEISRIEIVDGRVLVREPLRLGAAYVPTDFQSLNAVFSLAYRPVTWSLVFASAAFTGRGPDLTLTRLSGGIANGSEGWTFDALSVETPRSSFLLAGRLDRTVTPSVLDLQVDADRFAFQEWSGVLHGLENIAVETRFATRLKGPLAGLVTSLQLQGTGGSVDGTVTLNTQVPGWRGVGTLEVGRIDLSRWLNNPTKSSEISGRVTFDLDLNLGHFPRGSYTFEGARAAFMGYAAENVRAAGRLSATQALMSNVTATAYGAAVTVVSGSEIGLDAPYPFRFLGHVTGIDLRDLPPSVPVPHVESTLAFDYNVTGRFSEPYIAGSAAFDPSVFLGAEIGAGATGTVDTLADPIAYAGEGDLEDVNVNRWGQDLDVGWMREPRYAGTLSGHFKAQGSGSTMAELRLSGGGRLVRARMFQGALSEADVAIDIEDGTLSGTYTGDVSGIDPAVALDDPRFAASLTGTATVRARVRDLLVRSPGLADYEVTSSVLLSRSVIRGVPLDQAAFRGTLQNQVLHVDELRADGPGLAGTASGRMSFADQGVADLAYDFSRLDLSELRGLTGQDTQGLVATAGRVTGPYAALRLAGIATVTRFDAGGVNAPAATGDYDVTIPSGDLPRARARVTGEAAFPIVFNQPLQQASGALTMDAERVSVDVRLSGADGRDAGLHGDVVLHEDGRGLDLDALTVTFGGTPWRLAPGPSAPVLSWTSGGIAVQPVVFLGGEDGDQRLEISGTWREDGGGALRVTGRHVFLDTLESTADRPALYGGVADLDAVVRGTRDNPAVTGQISVINGRVQRVNFDSLAGRIDYSGDVFTVDLRLDQAPGVWLTATGTVPMAAFRPSMPAGPLNVRIVSSPVELGLIEGLTSVVSGVHGIVSIDVTALGTSRDPRVDGSVDVSGAAFTVAASGARYQNVRASLRFAQERIIVDALHMEDRHGDPLDVQGTMATRGLRVSDLQIEAAARHFELLRNEYGGIEADARLRLLGAPEGPRLGGTVTISAGDLNVDRILERALFQPYSTEPASIADAADAIAALNPWERLGLDVELRVPNSLKLSGENIQIASGAPIGLGDINLRATGDLYVYKDPAGPAYVTGSFDSLSGSYRFQGRNFDVDPTSSVNFRGDLNPEVYVTVKRVISGVETRVTIAGPMNEPELRLASTPPLDTTDILSLIVFNTSSNQLTRGQQQELAVRAGALAAGFLATPIISALQGQLGLDILQIETAGEGLISGPRITVGDEIAPGLVARFSRQFGVDAYDELIIEYSLSRLLRLRATLSDAQLLNIRAPFQRRERAGLDLLVFLSF